MYKHVPIPIVTCLWSTYDCCGCSNIDRRLWLCLVLPVNHFRIKVSDDGLLMYVFLITRLLLDPTERNLDWTPMGLKSYYLLYNYVKKEYSIALNLAAQIFFFNYHPKFHINKNNHLVKISSDPSKIANCVVMLPSILQRQARTAMQERKMTTWLITKRNSFKQKNMPFLYS